MISWRTLLKSGALTAFVLTIPFAARAAEAPPVSVKAEVDRAFITIGDPVVYTVTVRHKPSVQVLSRIPPPSKDLFKIKKIEEIRREEDGMVVEGRRFTLTSFALGEYILDPIEIQYRERDLKDASKETISTNRIFVTVKSVAEGEPKTDIRGAKPVIGIPGSARWILLLLLLAILLTAGLFFYRRWRKLGPLPETPETVLSAEEEALLHLQQLFDSDLIRQNRIKEYYLRLSEILRIYFERRYQVLAVELTTSEIMDSLKSKDMDTKLRAKIQNVLESADLAKFAKWRPEPSKVVEINKGAKDIIELSKPRRQEVPSGV